MAVDATSFASDNVTQAITASAAEALRLYSNATAVTSAVEPIAPMVDAEAGVINGQFLDLLQNGNLPNAGIPVMMGNTHDEAVSTSILR